MSNTVRNAAASRFGSIRVTAAVGSWEVAGGAAVKAARSLTQPPSAMWRRACETPEFRLDRESPPFAVAKASRRSPHGRVRGGRRGAGRRRPRRRSGAAARPRVGGQARRPARWQGRAALLGVLVVGGRSQSVAWPGWSVSRATPSTSSCSEPRSTCSRSRPVKASRVHWASRFGGRSVGRRHAGCGGAVVGRPQPRRVWRALWRACWTALRRRSAPSRSGRCRPGRRAPVRRSVPRG